MTHRGVWGGLDTVSWEILVTGKVFISIVQVSGSGVKKRLGEVRGGCAFPVCSKD